MIDYSQFNPPFRLAVLRELCEQLKDVNPDRGFIHDLRDFDADGRTERRVFRGRTRFGAGDPLPMISVLEDTRQDPTNAPPTTTSTVGMVEWQIALMGFVEDDMDDPTDSAHFLSAEIMQRLGEIRAQGPDHSTATRGNILGFGDECPCVNQVAIGQPVVRPAEDGVSVVAFFFIPITLTLIENLTDTFGR